MQKKANFMGLSALKDIIWAILIFISLLAVIVGFFFSVFTRYNGSRESRTARLSESVSSNVTADGSDTYSASLLTVQSSNTAATDLGSLTFLTDSICIGLRDHADYTSRVWGSQTGTLPISSVSSWTIRFSDGSQITPYDAAMITKPSVLVILVGSDGLGTTSKETFCSNYTAMLTSMRASSPDTILVCCSVIYPTENYMGTDGLTADRVRQANEWIQQICVDSGTYYADIASTLTSGDELISSYAESNGKSLNNTGITELLAYLQACSID